MEENKVENGKASTFVSIAAHQMPVTFTRPMKPGDLGRGGGAPLWLPPIRRCSAC